MFSKNIKYKKIFIYNKNMNKNNKPIKKITKKFYILYCIVAALCFISFIAIIIFFGAGTEKGINYLLIGFGIFFALIFIASVLFLIIYNKRVSQYERDKIKSKILIDYNVDENYDYETFKAGVENKADKLNDFCYSYYINNFYSKFHFFKKEEITKEIVFEINNFVKTVKQIGNNIVYIEIENYKDEYYTVISDALRDMLDKQGSISFFNIFVYDNSKKNLHSFTVTLNKIPVLQNVNSVVEAVASKKKKYRKKYLYKIKSKKLSIALKVIGAILIIGSFIFNLIPVKSTFDHNLMVCISMISFFVGSSVFFIVLYRNVNLVNIISFIILSIYFVLSRFLIVQHEFILFMVTLLVILPILFIAKFKYESLHLVVIYMCVYAVIISMSNISDVSYINENDLRLYIPPLIMTLIVTGIFTFLILYKKTSKYFLKNIKTNKKGMKSGIVVTLISCCLLISFMCSYALVNTINAGFTDISKVENIKVRITKKHSSGGRTTIYYFDFEYLDNKCNVSVPLQHYKYYEVNDIIIISIYPGALGIDYFYYHVELNNYYIE